MTTARQLYELQECDWQIDRSQADLASVEERLHDDSALVRARKEAAEQAENLRQMRKQHTTQNLEVHDLQEKIKALEGRLYSGVVKNPRELESLENEIHYTKERAGQAEEALLTVMINLDELEGWAAKSTSDLSQMETEWESNQATLSQDKATLTEQLASLNRRRGDLVADTKPSELARYDKLRKTRQGYAVAKVERGMCQGCQLTLPTKELQSVRAAQEPVQCNSCGRILYLS